MNVTGDELVALIGKQQVEIYALNKALQEMQKQLTLPALKAPVEPPPETR